MKKEATNIFSEGINLDLNPVATPNNVLTDAINATFVTFNGDELTLQNDAGNTRITVDGEDVQLSAAPTFTDPYHPTMSKFLPLGIKEYGGVLYIISASLPIDNVVVWSNATTYQVGQLAYSLSLVTGEKLYYKKKTIGSEALPEETNQYWEVIGNSKDFNNYFGMVEFGSYPAPEGAGLTEYPGDNLTLEIGAPGDITTIYRWIPTGSGASCVLDASGRNTGKQQLEEKYQYSTDGGATWTDDSSTPTKMIEITNTTDCPLPESYAAICVVDIAITPVVYNPSGETVIPYSENEYITVQTPIRAGYSYALISIPQGKSLTVRDTLNIDITDKFIKIGTDDRPTHTLNDVYQKEDFFGTDLATTYYIKIS